MVFTVLAVLIGVYAHQLLDVLHYLVGSVMVLFGCEGIFFAFVKSKHKFFTDYQLYLGHVDVLLGLVVLTAVRQFDYICVIWATWTIVRESFDIYEISHKVLHKFPAVFSMVLSTVEIIYSVMMIISATEHHALTHIYLLIPELMINALSPVLFEIHTKRKSKQ